MKTFDTPTAKKLHRNRRAMYRAVLSNINRYRDKRTGGIKKKYLERRNCPVCDKNQPNFLFYKNGGCYNICKECSMIYLNPVFKQTELKKYYEQNHSFQAKAHKNEKTFYKNIYNSGIAQIKKIS